MAGVVGSEARVTKENGDVSRKWGFKEDRNQTTKAGAPSGLWVTSRGFGNELVPPIASGCPSCHPEPEDSLGEAGSWGSPVSLEQWLSLELSRHHQDSEAGRATVLSRVLHLLASRRPGRWNTRPGVLPYRPRPPGIALTTCSASRSCRSFSRR